jgi:hypothetical protein
MNYNDKLGIGLFLVILGVDYIFERLNVWFNCPLTESNIVFFGLH